MAIFNSFLYVYQRLLTFKIFSQLRIASLLVTGPLDHRTPGTCRGNTPMTPSGCEGPLGEVKLELRPSWFKADPARDVARRADFTHTQLVGLASTFSRCSLKKPSTSLFWCWPGYTVYSYPFWLTPCAIVVGWTPSSRWYWSPLS